jgi:hypothetical protein
MLLAISTDTAREITLVVISFALLLVLIAVLRSRRDKAVRRTKWGFFIERDRYGDEDTYRTNFGREKPFIPPDVTQEIKKP